MPDFCELNKEGVKTLDVLVYVAIRWSLNTEDRYGFLPYEKIMKLSNLGRTFVAGSINRLERAGYLRIERSKRKGKCNQYYFKHVEHFERVPYELFEQENLSSYEMAILLCVRKFFTHGRLHSMYKIKDFARLLGISYQQVYKPFKCLIKKGYIAEHTRLNRNGKVISTSYFLTEKIDWDYDYSTRSTIITKLEPEKVKQYLMIS